MILEKIFLVFLTPILLIGTVISSEDVLYASTKNILFDYQDSTNGLGSFSSYNELVNQEQEHLKNTDHGSGTIEEAKIIDANQTVHVLAAVYAPVALLQLLLVDVVVDVIAQLTLALNH